MRSRALGATLLVVAATGVAAGAPAAVPGGAGHRLLPVAPAESLAIHDVLGGTPTPAGPAVVILPSLVGSAAAFRQVAAGLGPRRVVIIDPLGMGASPRPPGADYSLAAQGARVSAALDALGLGEVVLVAHGVSASIAWRVAARASARVAGIVSVEGGLVESQATPGLSMVRWLAPLADTPLGRRVARGRFRDALITGSADRAWVTDSLLDAYLSPAVRALPATVRAWSRMAAAHEPDRTADALRAASVPIRLLVGGAPGPRRRQGGVARAEVDRMRQLAPQLVVDTITGSGWFVHEERPAAVVAAIQSLLAPVTAGR
jgi:pimeloyl-ACP methyl ester carboxylesterase